MMGVLHGPIPAIEAPPHQPEVANDELVTYNNASYSLVGTLIGLIGRLKSVSWSRLMSLSLSCKSQATPSLAGQLIVETSLITRIDKAHTTSSTHSVQETDDVEKSAPRSHPLPAVITWYARLTPVTEEYATMLRILLVVQRILCRETPLTVQSDVLHVSTSTEESTARSRPLAIITTWYARMIEIQRETYPDHKLALSKEEVLRIEREVAFEEGIFMAHCLAHECRIVRKLGLKTWKGYQAGNSSLLSASMPTVNFNASIEQINIYLGGPGPRRRSESTPPQSTDRVEEL